MGRKKKGGGSDTQQEKKTHVPSCYYCERLFDDLGSLDEHMRQKHFRCEECPRTFGNISGLAIHVHQVHKHSLHSVRAANPGRERILPFADMDRNERVARYGEIAMRSPSSTHAASESPVIPVNYSALAHVTPPMPVPPHPVVMMAMMQQMWQPPPPLEPKRAREWHDRNTEGEEEETREVKEPRLGDDTEPRENSASGDTVQSPTVVDPSETLDLQPEK